MANAVVRIAPNNPVFDLPVLVGIEEGLFRKAGLDVAMSATYDDRERDTAESKIFERLKEGMFERGSADSYNVCEWASIDRVERGSRGGKLAALRAAVAAQAIVTFDAGLQVPRDLADVPVAVQEHTGSHFTTLQMLEGAFGREHVQIAKAGLPQLRWKGLKDGQYRAVTVMEPFISLGLEGGRAHRRGRVLSRRRGDRAASDAGAARRLLRRRERGGRSHQRRFLPLCPSRRGPCQGRARAP